MSKITKPVDANQTGINNYLRKHYTSNHTPTKAQGNFIRQHLPMPIVGLNKLNIKPGKANRGGYWILHCPFHDDTKPSLNLHQVSGHFKCHACGKKGGDILDFYRAVTQKGFIEAVKDLGAWEVKK